MKHDGAVIATYQDEFGDERKIHRTKNGLKIRRENATPAMALSGPAGVLVGERIRKMRLKRGLSQADLAIACGFIGGHPKRRMHDIERPSLTRSKGILLGTLYAIAVALDCSPKDLLPTTRQVMDAAKVERNHSPIARVMLKSTALDSYRAKVQR